MVTIWNSWLTLWNSLCLVRFRRRWWFRLKLKSGSNMNRTQVFCVNVLCLVDPPVHPNIYLIDVVITTATKCRLTRRCSCGDIYRRRVFIYWKSSDCNFCIKLLSIWSPKENCTKLRNQMNHQDGPVPRQLGKLPVCISSLLSCHTSNYSMRSADQILLNVLKVKLYFPFMNQWVLNYNQFE